MNATPTPMPSKVVQINNFGALGTNEFKAQHLSQYFNYDLPYNFGLKVARRWSSLQPNFYPKILTAMTLGAGSIHNIDTMTYQWSVGEDIERRFRFMEDASDINSNVVNNRIGYNGEPFSVVLDVNWARTGSVLALEDNNYRVVVLNDGDPVGSYWRYRVEVQGSDPNKAIPVVLLNRGKPCTETASVAKEYGNQQLPGVSFGTATMYQNVIGMCGRQVTIDERTIKKEIQRRKNGGSVMSSSNGNRAVDVSDWASGFAFKMQSKDKTTGEIKEIDKSAFITWAEAKVTENVFLDREYMMKFGEFSEKMDPTLQYINTRVAPGSRSLTLDGQVRYHSGDWTTDDFQSYLDGLFIGRRAMGDSHIVATTGRLGFKYFDAMVAQQYRGLMVGNNSVMDASFFIRATDLHKGHGINGLEFGSQFVSFVGTNGIKVTLQHDPMLDDFYYCLRPYFDDTQYPIDSLRFDFYDLGSTNVGNYYTGSNVAMLTQSETEQVYWRMGRMNPFSGYIRGTVTNEETDATYKHIITGSLQIWDTSRIGAVIYEPDYEY